VSIIFSDGFTNGANNWTHSSGAGFRYYGCAGSRCLTCGVPNNFQISKSFYPTTYTSLTVRMMLAYFLQTPGSSDVGQFIITTTAETSPTTANTSFEVYVDGNGAIHVNAFDTGTAVNTANGIVPLDGSWHAYQMAYTYHVIPASGGFHDVAIDITIVKDNVTVGTWTGLNIATNDHGASPKPANSGGFHMQASLITSPFTRNIAIDNVQVEDSFLITTWSLCSGTTKINATSCAGGFTPAPDFSGVYTLVPGLTHDTTFSDDTTTSDGAIPNPFAITYPAGD